MTMVLTPIATLVPQAGAYDALLADLSLGTALLAQNTAPDVFEAELPSAERIKSGGGLVLEKALAALEETLQRAEREKKARHSAAQMIQDRDMVRLLRRDHLPLILKASRENPILINLMVRHRPDLFVLEDVAVIREFSVWAALQLIAFRPDWSILEVGDSPQSPYEPQIARHHRDVMGAEERHRQARDAAHLMMAAGAHFAVPDILDGAI